MPLDFRRSWSDEAVESFRDSWVRFVESEMQPNDAEARRRGHVGHELWRRAGEFGFLCVDIPEQWGGAGGDFRHEAVLHEEMARRALSGMSIEWLGKELQSLLLLSLGRTSECRRIR